MQTGPNIRAALSNAVSSDQRGLAFASFTLFDDLGKGAGPVAVAALVHAFGRTRAFAWSMLGWLPCALLCGCTALTVGRDEATLIRNEAPLSRAPDSAGCTSATCTEGEMARPAWSQNHV